MRIELITSGSTNQRSNQLSYKHHKKSSTPDRIRTYDLRIRSALLYPAELRAHIVLSFISEVVVDFSTNCV